MMRDEAETDPKEGPSLADLAAIEAEWPVIEAEMDVVAAEIAVLTGPGRKPTELEWQRLRAAERALIAVWLVYAATHRGGQAVA